MYDIAFIKYENEVPISKWMEFVRNTLFANGFGYVWIEQAVNTNVNQFKSEFKERICNQFVQTWQNIVSNSSKCSLYREIKIDFQLEPYLFRVPFYLSKYLLKFRTCNHKLDIEAGRYINLEKNERHCRNCNLNTIGDEFHLFYECQNESIIAVGNQYIPRNVLGNFNMFKFVNLLKKLDNIAFCTRKCKFLKNSNLM